MSRKDFEAIAAEFRSLFDETKHLRSDADRIIADATIRDCIRAVARACANSNPRFDTNTFIAACGIN